MAAHALGPLTFAQATSIKQLSSHVYQADFPDDWCIGSVPHGGFVTSCFLQVSSKHFQSTLAAQNQPHAIALHPEFLYRTNTGPAIFTVRDVKLGRQASVIHVTLAQGLPSQPRDEVVGYITHSNISAESGMTLTTPFELHPAPPPVDLRALERGTDVHWADRGRMPFATFRKASQKVDFHLPRTAQVRGIGEAWLRFASGERFTNASLGYIVDMFPVPAESLVEETNPYDFARAECQDDSNAQANRWYPTLALNLDIKKKLPDEGVDWLFVRAMAKKITNGRMDLEVIVMDESGDMVALSNHVTLALTADRNVAGRKEVKPSKI